MKRHLQLIVLLMAILFQYNALAQTKDSQTIYFEEDFDGWTDIEAEGWFTYSPVSWNYITPQEDYISFFKQDPADYMMLISPEIDFTEINLLEFHYKAGSSVSPQKLEIGVMSDPTDPSTFQILNIITVEGLDWIVDDPGTPLSSITGLTHLAFNISASSPTYTIIDIDNVKLSDEGEEMAQPNFISDFEVQPLGEGANMAELSWTNPSTQADGGVLTDLDSLVILANDEYAKTIYEPEIGGAVTTMVDVPEAGLYVFTVTAYNSEGASVGISNDPPVWVGLDTPGSPENIELTVTGENTSNLSWTAPAVGAHGGYFDGIVNTYLIQRADGEIYTVEGDVLSFTEDVAIPGTYNYAVSCVNESGEGSAEVSNTGVYYFDGFLLAEDYWVSNPAFGWTLEGDSPDNWFHWGTDYSGGNYGESIYYAYYETSEPQYNISPVINSSGYESLTLRFRHSQYWKADSYTFKVQTTSDGGQNWTDVWVLEVTESYPATSELVVINNDDIGSENLQIAFVVEATTTSLDFLTFDDIWLYESSDVDMVAMSLSIPELIQPGNTVSSTAIVENWGAQETDFTATLTYADNDGEVYTSVKNGTLSGGANMELTFDDWTAIEGVYSAELVIEAEEDENIDNNTITQTFNVYYLNAERTLVVCEEATYLTCGYCPGAAMGLDDLVENGWPVAITAYHNGDPYETDEGLDRIDFYGIDGYPTVVFDGTTVIIGGSATESLYDNYLPVIQERLAVPAAISLDIDNVYIQGNVLHADIAMSSDSPIQGENISLLSTLSESHIPENWQGFNEVNFVTRTMYNGAQGTNIDMSDHEENVHISITLDPEWVIDNSELVVFAQDLDSKEIFNGNKIDLLTVSVDNIEKWVAIYPNPATDNITISGCEKAEVSLYNLQGQKMINDIITNDQTKINVSDLQFGIYLIELKMDGKKFSRKIMIK